MQINFTPFTYWVVDRLRPVRLNLSAIVQCFSLTTNQPTVLSVMTYQPSEQTVDCSVDGEQIGCLESGK
jgi:hypothetical protein